jgi:hypothetical protein
MLPHCGACSLQAEAIGARYASTWSERNKAAAVPGKGAGGAAAAGAANPLLAGTKFDPFAPSGGQVRQLAASIMAGVPSRAAFWCSTAASRPTSCPNMPAQSLPAASCPPAGGGAGLAH